MSKSKYTVNKNEDLYEVKDELGSTLEVFEKKTDAHKFIRELNTEKPTVTHMEGDYGNRETAKPKVVEPVIEETPVIVNAFDPIIHTIDFRPVVKAAKIAVQNLVGIASKAHERAGSKAGKIRAYFKEAMANKASKDEIVEFLMKEFGETKPRAKAYLKWGIDNAHLIF